MTYRTEGMQSRTSISLALVLVVSLSACQEDDGSGLSDLGDPYGQLDWCGLVEITAHELTGATTGAPIDRDSWWENDGTDPCVCGIWNCVLVEILPDLTDCMAIGLPCYTRGEYCDIYTDADGSGHSVCHVPELGTEVVGCDSMLTDCSDVSLERRVSGTGWYYISEGMIDEEGGTPAAADEIRFHGGYTPMSGSRLFLHCSDCMSAPTGVVASGGAVGSSCSPSVCDLTPEVCIWEEGQTYMSESSQCSGGACLGFRSGGINSYCTRECGVTGDLSPCPAGFSCYPVFGMSGFHVGTCFCVEDTQLSLGAGGADQTWVDQCS